MKRQLDDRIENYTKLINGACSCGQPVVKIINSNATARVDGIRYHYPNETTAWCIFRCKICQNVIDKTFKPMVGLTLFDVPPIPPVKFCKTCEHRERHQCGGSIIQYCGIRKSNRTNNGKLKIKCKTPACDRFKQIMR